MYHAVSFSRVRRSVEWPSLPPEMMPSQMSEVPVVLIKGECQRMAKVSNYETEFCRSAQVIAIVLIRVVVVVVSSRVDYGLHGRATDRAFPHSDRVQNN